MTASVRVSYVPYGRPLWSLLEDVEVDLEPDRSRPIVVRGRWGPARVPDNETLVRVVLDRMSLGPVSLENVPGLDDAYRSWRAGSGDCSAWRRVRDMLDLLGGRVVPSLGSEDGGSPLLSLVANGERARFRLPEPPRTDVRLVDGARLVRGRRAMTLDRPGAGYRVQLLRDGVLDLVLALLDRPFTSAGELAVTSGLPEPTVLDVVAYLAGAGLAAPAEPSRTVGAGDGTCSTEM